MKAAAIILCITAIWIALGLACALRVAGRRRTGASQVASDPYFYEFGEMPIVPREAVGNYRRHLDADDFRPWGVPSGMLTWPRPIMMADIDRLNTSACALRRNENGGHQRPVSSLSSGPAAVLTFPVRRP